jgi:uncharacterized protein (TIGR02646 family)
MRNIFKNQEPDSLAEYRTKEGCSFEDMGSEIKEELRKALVSEQGGLCCYCCGRISPDKEGMNIEHWKSQKKHKENQLAYWNLLASCKGNPGQPKKFTHCDHHKGDRSLSKNPSDFDHGVEKYISFLPDGRITASDPSLNRELGGATQNGKKTDRGVLNLNMPLLINNRKKALEGFVLGLRKIGTLKKPRIEKLIQQWSGRNESKLNPYAPVVVYWLRKRLKRS